MIFAQVDHLDLVCVQDRVQRFSVLMKPIVVLLRPSKIFPEHRHFLLGIVISALRKLQCLLQKRNFDQSVRLLLSCHIEIERQFSLRLLSAFLCFERGISLALFCRALSQAYEFAVWRRLVYRSGWRLSVHFS
jgi:hypothetical protein